LAPSEELYMTLPTIYAGFKQDVMTLKTPVQKKKIVAHTKIPPLTSITNNIESH
jgi:hypothetical protein